MDGVAYLDKKTKTKITFNELKLLEISKMNELMIDGCGRTSKKTRIHTQAGPFFHWRHSIHH